MFHIKETMKHLPDSDADSLADSDSFLRGSKNIANSLADLDSLLQGADSENIADGPADLDSLLKSEHKSQ